MKIKSKNVPELIRNRMVELGMTQIWLSKRMGLSQNNCQHIHNVLKQKCQIPPKHVNKLSSALGIKRETIVDSMVQDYRESLENEVYNG